MTGRPWFRLAVTGRADLIPTTADLYGCSPALLFDRRPELAALAERLDVLLARRRCGHRVFVHVRADGRGAAGIDQAARRYAAWRGFESETFCPEPTPWGPPSPLVRDLAMLMQSNALVWVGPREGDQDAVFWARTVGMRVELVELPGLTPAAASALPPAAHADPSAAPPAGPGAFRPGARIGPPPG